jgi:eukaryotic-like serine/threonine-protein kinase
VAQQGATAHFAISSHGALVYVPRDAVGGLRPQRTLVWVDRQGHEDPIKAPRRAYFNPRLSPDGTRVALEVRDQESDIWIWDLVRETLTRLTFGPTFEQYGVWTPDGRAVIFSSSELGGPNTPRSLFRRRSDGTGAVEQLTQGAVAQFPSTVTPDGTALIFRQQTPPKLGTPPGMDLVLLPLEGERRPRPLVQTPFDELNGEVSRDGHWLAYQSNESGRDEIYVRPFPNVDGGKWQVSTNGGTQPLWARNGQELFYESMGALMQVPLTVGSTFEAGTPRKLFAVPSVVRALGLGLGRTYDVSADGQRFLMIKESGGADERPPSPRMILVQSWFEELKRLVPAR